LIAEAESFAGLRKTDKSGLRRTTTGAQGGGDAPLALGFLGVEIIVGFGEKFFDALAIAAIDGNADAGGEARRFLVIGHYIADAIGDAMGFVGFRFGQYKGEFVSAVARGGVYGAAVDTENIGEPANGAAADEMAVAIVDFFQVVEIQEQNRKGAAGAVGALGFVFEDVEETAIVDETGERIADGEMADLFEEVRVIEQRAAEGNGETQDQEGLGENERSVQQALGLRSRKLGGDVEPGRGVDGAIKRGVHGGQAATVPDETDEENRAREKLLRAGEKSARMRGNFRRQAAQGDSQNIGETDYAQQSAGNLAARMAGTREEVFDQQGDHQQESKHHAADPPGDGRPEKAQRRVWQELKEENAGGHQDGAREKEAGTEDQGDAVLGTLETNEGYSGEDKGEQAADNLKVALEERIGLQHNAAQPESGYDDEEEATGVGQKNGGATAAVHERSLVPRASFRPVHDSPGRAPTSLDY